MRVPLSKAYRALPELDEFTDAQCQRYMREAREQHRGIVGAWGALGLIVFFGGLIGSSIVASRVHLVVTGRGLRDAPPLVFLLILASGGLATGVGAMALNATGLRKAIGKRLEGARCAACLYPLLGLVVRDGMVRCPECGREERLEVRGLTSADIMAVPGGSVKDDVRS